MTLFKTETVFYQLHKPLREKPLVNYRLTLRKMGYRCVGGNTWVKPGYAAIMWPKKKYRRI